MKTKTALPQRKQKASAQRAQKSKLVRVRAVQPLHDFWVHVTFTNDVERDIDLKAELWGPVFEPLRNDPALFRQVYVDPISRTLAWPGELDLDPDTLYYGENPPWAQRTSKPKAVKSKPKKIAVAATTRRKTLTVKPNGTNGSPKSRTAPAMRASARAK